MSTLALSAHTHGPRHRAVSAVTLALDECGVILQDMHEYSNRMITYQFEIDLEEVPRLRQRLLDAELVLEEPGADVPAPRPDADGFIRATLRLTFPGEDGNKRNPNPDMG